MEKTAAKLSKNKSNIKRLFELDGTDQFYTDVKKELYPWHAAAKTYWQQLYEKYHMLLDREFVVKLSHECFSCLWELSQIDFLAQHQSHGLSLHAIFGKASRPDFCFGLHEKKFYLEAVSASPGNSPELNVSLSEVSGIARRTPVAENMERLCSAVREKAHTKYYGEKTCGYKCYMEEDSGLIISISLAKIPFHNQSNNFHNDLRCIFGISPTKLPLTSNKENSFAIGSPYHDHQSSFKKITNKSEEKEAQIKMDYFSNNEYSHISGIILSHTGLSFFPDIDQFVDYCHWKNCRNDYILIHNPFAKVPLPLGFFNVSREITTNICNGEFEINF